jgi:hypothetical protein
LNFHHGKSIVQIFTEALFDNEGPGVVIRGSDDPDVHLPGTQRSYALDFLILQDAEELGLGRERHIPYLVEKQSAPMGMLEQAGLVIRRAGERPLHMPEQLAFK